MSAFDDFLAPLDPPLVVVTTVHGDDHAGCIVGFHGQSSIDPEHYAVWISRTNRTYVVAARAERFAVHVVGVHDRSLAELFGGTTGDDIDKFARCRWSVGPGGVRLLDDLPHRFVGRRVGLVDGGGDHVCITLAPEVVEADEDAGQLTPMRASALADLEPGHEADEPR